jgi:hypothetical protein
MRRFTVMGFTEAELGFVLAALFAAIAVATLNDRDASASSLDELRDAALQRDSVAVAFAHFRDSTRADLHRLRDSLAAVEQPKRSSKVPQCWERGEQREPIAAVIVLGRDRFVLDSDTLSIDGIRGRLATPIARGDSLGCRFVLRARPTGGVDAVEQSDAVWRLRRYFDVDDRPQ